MNDWENGTFILTQISPDGGGCGATYIILDPFLIMCFIMAAVPICLEYAAKKHYSKTLDLVHPSRVSGPFV